MVVGELTYKRKKKIVSDILAQWMRGRREKRRTIGDRRGLQYVS